MTASNLLQIYYVPETTLGTTPASPNMTRLRVTNESLKTDRAFVQSDEITGDRIKSEYINVGTGVSGGFGFELSFGWADDFFESAQLSTWVESAVRDNDGTPDSVITGVSAASDTFTVIDATYDFAPKMLARSSGFTNAGNNQLFITQAGTNATAVVAPSSPGLTDETAPPGTARIKAIGFVGDVGDVAADATGLTSTTTDFTTFGLSVGQWVKIGGTAAGTRFDLALLNTFVRIASIAANDLNFDYLPAGWAADAGTGKTIYVFTADKLDVGSLVKSFTIEKVFTGQATPVYQSFRGCTVNGLTLTFNSQDKITGSFDLIGFDGAESTTALDATPTAANQNLVMNTSSNLIRVMEGGSDQASPVWIQSASISLNNNIQPVTALANLAPVDFIAGDAALSVSISATFGNKTLIEKFLDATETSMAIVAARLSKAYVFDVVAMQFTDATAAAGGRNQVTTAEMTAQGKKSATTGKMFSISRFEEYQ